MSAFTAALFALLIALALAVNSGMFDLVAKTRLERLFNEEYRGRLVLKKVTIDFPDRITLLAPAIYEEGAGKPALSAARISFRFNVLSLLKPRLSTLSFNELVADRFRGELVEGADGKLNLDRIFTKRDPDKPETVKIENFRCRKASIRGASLLYDPAGSARYDLTSVDLDASKLFIGKNEVMGTIGQLRLAMPDRGFRLREASGSVVLSSKRSELIGLELRSDRSRASLSLSFDGLDLFSGISKGKLTKSRAFIHVESLQLHSDDLKQFANLKGVPEGLFSLKGDARGTLDELQVLPTSLEFDESRIGFEGEILNIGDPSALSFRLRFDKSKLSPRLLEQLTERENLRTLAREADGIGFTGSLRGKPAAWSADLEFSTRIGSGSVALDAAHDATGRLATEGDFAVEQAIPHLLLGMKGGNSTVSGSGAFRGTLSPTGAIESAHLEAVVSNASWQKQKISSGSLLLDYTGTGLKASADLKDDEGATLALNASTDLAYPAPAWQATGSTKRLDLSKASGSGSFRTDLNGTFEARGTGFDPGSMNIHLAALFEPSSVNEYQIRDRSALTAALVQSASSTAISLSSDFMDLAIRGNASFSRFIEATQLASAGLSREIGSPSPLQTALAPTPFDIDYRVTVRDLSPLAPLLGTGELMLNGSASGRTAWSGTRLSFDSMIDIERLNYGKALHARDISLKGSMQFTRTGISSALLTGSVGSTTLAEREIRGLMLNAGYLDSTLNASMELEVPACQERLSVSVQARRNGPLTNVSIRRFALTNPNGAWQAGPGSNIDLGASFVRFNRLNLSKGNQTIGFDGLLSSSSPGTFQCTLSNFDLGELKHFLLSPSLDRVGGRANARLSVSGQPGSKTTSLELRGVGTGYGDIRFGSLHLTAAHAGGQLRFDLETHAPDGSSPGEAINTIQGVGSIPMDLGYAPFRLQIPDNRPIRASFHSDDLSARFLVHLTDLVAEADGVMPTDLRISGNMPRPDITLTTRFDDARIRIAPTRVSYRVTGQVTGTPSRIDLGGIRLVDDQQGSGTISGVMRLSGFEPSSVDLSASCRNLLLYSKKDLKDDTSFGTIRGTTNRLRFSGELSEPTVEGELNVTQADYSIYRKGSNESAKYLGVEKFIEFVPRHPSPSAPTAAANGRKPAATQFNYALLDILQIRNLRLTCNVPLRYTMIFDRIRGERLEASIDNLSLNVNKSGQRFSLFGSVDIVGGKYAFSNTSFDLDSGGRIVWNSQEIRDGQLDGIYGVKNVSASDQQTGERDNVKLLLAIGGTINEPNVRMGYYLNDDQQPYSATTMIGRQSSHIDPNADLNVISLMLSRQWYIHPERQMRTGSLAVSSVGVSAGTGMLSSQLSGLVQGLAGLESFNVNLGTDNAGALRGLELYIALQVPGTGGKLRVIGTGTTPTGNSTANGGTVGGSSQKIEYRVNSKVYVEAFRSSGQTGGPISTTNLQKPTENWGASLSYREKFHTWSQFWNRLTGTGKRREQRPPAAGSPSSADPQQAPALEFESRKSN
jgi:hypothetical protein